MIDSVEPNLPVTPGMINLWEHGAVHATEFGYCVHDYMMSPCDKFRDCINCNEQVCVKGEEEAPAAQGKAQYDRRASLPEPGSNDGRRTGC